MAGSSSVAPEPRKYRYVTWHRSKPVGWIAQVPSPHGLRKQRTVGTAMESQVDAAKAAAAAMGVTVASLLLSKPGIRAARRKTQPALKELQSNWQYVYWHGGSKRWEVRICGETLGYHATDQEAAAQVRVGWVRARQINLVARFAF